MMGESVFFDRRISYLGDCTWSSMSGRRVQLKPVPVQCLSELERVRLQEVAFNRLHQDYDLGCQITIPRDGQNHKKSLRRKLDSLSKEKSRDKEFASLAFSIPLSQVIANDRAHKQRPDHLPGDNRDPSDLVSSILQFAIKRPSKELSSSNSSLGSTPEMPNECVLPNTPETAPRAHRRGGMSVDSITDLDDSQSRLLEALQLTLPTGSPSKKEKHRDEKLSLNPIYRLVPRLVDSCCQHLEKYGIQTVGIFRVGSSKKRVRQLREEFDRGTDVLLDEDHSVHDVAALLKEFLRDMPDPLLTKELYTAFINTTLLDSEGQQSSLQLLIYLLPPCNSDTLHRLLEFLSTVAAHAHDTQDKDGQEVTGNKMTSLNLATIFGPNLLHKQKSSDKEFSVQSSARAEESAAVIAVVQRMIDTYDTLFMVPPDLQNEVLMSLLETDPDVVDYLLRRKDSQWSSMDALDSDVPFSLTERHSSSDSIKASSAELSPYDNDCSLLSDDFLHKMAGYIDSGAMDLGSAPWPAKDEHADIWEAWRAMLRSELKDPPNTGSHRTLSHSPPEGSCDQLGDRKPQRIQTSLATAKFPQAPVACGNSSSHTEREQGPLEPHALLPQRDSHSESSCAEDLPQGSGLLETLPSTTKPPFRSKDTPPLPQTGHSMRLTVSTPHRGPLQCRGPGPQKESSQTPAGSEETKGPVSPDWQDWQRERWQIWQLLSLDNTDSLPETLV
ncbi:rho GTPase-activating protein 6-like [Anguilla rostrata]|uniref:rho GTPase-activating protein 6-like n=1 Tax=Anguilla rostrata TaxID=7938 RepID=UPI0030CD5851